LRGGAHGEHVFRLISATPSALPPQLAGEQGFFVFCFVFTKKLSLIPESGVGQEGEG
jgi:hypothetical protein